MPTQIATLQSLANELGLTLVCVPEGAPLAEALDIITGNPVVDERDVMLWRFAFWTERKLLERLTGKKKSAAGKKAYKALDDYVNLVNNKVFLTANVVQRAVDLSRAFKDNARISAKLAHEMNGEDFDDEHTTIPKDLFQQTYKDCRLSDLAISTYVENRARLAALKAATDYLLLKRDGVDHNESYTVKLEEFEVESGGNLLDLVPASYRVGLETIADDLYLHRYPVFWQWFLWCFGGFLLLDRLDQEYELLAQKTGIPKDHIPDALKVFDTLFPSEGKGWFRDYYGIKLVQLASVPFMGIGANLRRLYHAGDKTFDGLILPEDEAKNKLLQWNNCIVELLA